MEDNSFILKAYESALALLDDATDPQIIIKTNISNDHHHIVKAIEPIKMANRFWTNASQKSAPVYFISVNEFGKDYLYDQLKELNFLDAMPDNSKWNEKTSDAIFGSGGHSFVDNKPVLLYWQVAGSNNKFDDTGTLKTAPHLFTHAIQSATFVGSGNIITDLPGWFVEGQADFVGLFSISKSFSDYLSHRRNFFSIAYVPGEHENKVKIKKYSVLDWYESMLNSPQKFAGIKLVDEYYSGLLAYELLLSIVGSANIISIYKKFLDGKDFYELVKIYSGYTKEEFCMLVAQKLFLTSKNIIT